MISPPMMSSGMNASPSAKRRPISCIASLPSAMMASGSVPPSTMRLCERQRLVHAQPHDRILELLRHPSPSLRREEHT